MELTARVTITNRQQIRRNPQIGRNTANDPNYLSLEFSRVVVARALRSSSEIILQTNDVVFTEVHSALHFNKDEQVVALIFDSMRSAD